MNPEFCFTISNAAESGDLATVSRMARESGSKWAHMVYQYARAKKAGRGDDASRAKDLADAMLGASIIASLEAAKRAAAAVAA